MSIKEPYQYSFLDELQKIKAEQQVEQAKADKMAAARRAVEKALKPITITEAEERMSVKEFSLFARKNLVSGVHLSKGDDATGDYQMEFRVPRDLIINEGEPTPTQLERNGKLVLIEKAINASFPNQIYTEFVQYRVSGTIAEEFLTSWVKLDGDLSKVTCLMHEPKIIRDLRLRRHGR